MKGLFKILAIALTLSALFAANAAAQCGGKEVYIQLPNNWGNTIYITWDGQFPTMIKGNPVGNWTVLTFPTGMPNDNQNNANQSKIVFLNKASNYDASGIYSINKTAIANSSNPPQPTTGFSCNEFSNRLYISEDPITPGKVNYDTSPPNAYYFYFLPPREKNWITSTSYLAYPMSGGNAIEALGIDPDKCGWYKKIFFGDDLPKNEPTFIYQGRNKANQIGLYGIAEDSADWNGGSPEPFNLKEKFDALLGLNKPGNIYFVADNGLLDGLGGWYSDENPPNIPYQSERCGFNFAAIIYDTDWKVNSSFQCGDYNGGINASQSSNCYSLSGGGTSPGSGGHPGGFGIIKNIPLSTLAYDPQGVPKMQWGNKSGVTNTDGWTQQNFEDAFKPTPGKNVVRCYDMPFKRNYNLWEFDSNKLCADNTLDLTGNCGDGGSEKNDNGSCKNIGNPGYMGGLFPPDLSENSLLNQADYSGCPDCKIFRFVESWAPYTNTISKFCYDRGRIGTSTNNINSCGRQFQDGDFRDGDYPTATAFWNWSGRPCFGGTASTSTEKNGLFCFESTPAKFKYDPDQEFFFSGDDDIWVYISNYLVIDLGGSHLAAPGYVKLSELKIPQNARVAGTKYGSDGSLVEGEEYPINIFFCDRRTTMSNVRIATNMYMAQDIGIFVKQGNGTDVPAQVCLKQSGGGSCAVTGGSSSGESEKCGAGLELDYYVVNASKTDTVYLDPNKNSECYFSNPGQITCYGGIIINPDNTVKINLEAVHTLVGTQIVYAKLKDGHNINPEPDPAEVARFSKRTTVKMAWGDIYYNGTLLSKACKENNNTVAGKLVPVCIADGVFNGPKTVFNVNEAPGQNFKFLLNGIKDEDKKAELKIYRDALGTDPVTEQNPTFTTPANGVLILWVSGGFEMDTTEYTYEINVNTREAPAKLTVRHPALKWVYADSLAKSRNIDTIAIPTGQNKGSALNNGSDKIPVGKGKNVNGFPIDWMFTGEDISLSLVAYDDVDAKTPICETCNFGLSHTAIACYDGAPGNPTNCNGPGSSLFSEINDELITLDGGVEKGIAHINIQGQTEVLGEPPANYARLMVRGPSEKGPTIFWDSLQFKEPPVPRPVSTELHDLDGDGRGDSLVIAYNRGFDKDSLPNKIEVFWGPDTLRFGIGNLESGKFVIPSSESANLAEWQSRIILGGTKTLEQRRGRGDPEAASAEDKVGANKDIKDTIIITKKDIKALKSGDTAFSEAVRTSGKGNIRNWASFKYDGKEYTIGFVTPIKDKMPAIVTSARYIAGTDGGCPSDAVPCRDVLTLEFSEPVYKVNSDNQNDISLFGYKLMSKNWDKFDTLKNLYQYQVRSARWLGDSTAVNFVFQNTGATDSPLPSDWVRFFSGLAAVKDAAGNPPNPNEQGCEIIGRSRFIPGKVAIGTASPGNDNLERSIQDVFDSLGIKAKAKDLFAKSRSIEFLPVPKGWTAQNAGDKYGGTVGMVLQPDVYSTLNELLDTLDVPDSAITFHARAFYHTNLGDFVVNRELPTIRCDSDIFPPGPNGKPSCRRDEEGKARNTGVYVAWNLKDSKARWVGAGAYVGLHDFRWEVNYDGKDISKGKNINIHESFDKVNRQVEMFGVRRVKAKK